jgi:DNA polymerase-4
MLWTVTSILLFGFCSVQWCYMVKDYKYLFLDMDAFFASIEQQENKKWRHHPVAIVHHAGPSGSIIAQSYEAKRAGIYTGQRVGEAKKSLPCLAIVSSRPSLYAHYHKRIKHILDYFSPWVTPYSIDEFSIVLAPQERNASRAKSIAHNIKKDIARELGECITGSIGVASNTFLAKIASKIKKPNGFFIIKNSVSREIFANIKDITFLSGINKATALQLSTFGLKTPLDMWSASAEKLRVAMGQSGERWYLNLHGYDTKKIHEPTKSVGHSRVLAPEHRNYKSAREALVELSINVARRLRASNLKAQKIEVSAKSSILSPENTTKRYHAYKTVSPTNNQTAITTIALALFKKYPHSNPYHIAITTSNLTHCRSSTQLSLIGDNKQYIIDKVVDSVNKKFGIDALGVYNFPHKKNTIKNPYTTGGSNN